LRAEEELFFGGDSPITQLVKKNFTYEYERENYFSRPYPVSGTFGEDIPFIGPLVAGTVGRLIKPPIMMHTEDWMTGDGEVKLRMGEGGGVPISPTGV
jgi:hypothetical protein